MNLQPIHADVFEQRGSTSSLLRSHQIDELWKLFVAIHKTWGNEDCRPEDMASRWTEFVRVKTHNKPSYLDEYRSACYVLDELRGELANAEAVYEYLFFDPTVSADPKSPLGRLKRLVVDEFIHVYVSSGGFRSFGGRNYAGFVSGSRFRLQRPYRTFEENRK